MGLIAQVSDIVYVGGFVTSIGKHGIMKNIYVLTQKTEPQGGVLDPGSTW